MFILISFLLSNVGIDAQGSYGHMTDIIVFLLFVWQLASVTEERDRLKNVVDELRAQNTVAAGGDVLNGTLFKVLQLQNYFIFFSRIFLFLMGSLLFSLPRTGA